MQAVKITEQQFSEYDSYVASHQSGSFLQSRIWGNFQASNDAEVVQYLFRDENNIIGSAQIFLKTAPGINKQYLYCPYGPLTNPESLDINFFIEQLKQDFPEVICIRIEAKSDYKLNGVRTIRIQPQETVVNDLTKSTDEILAGMHQKTRYNIKLAEKHGVKVEVIEDAATATKALELFEQTSQRQGFKNFPLEYYQNMFQQLGQNNGMAKLYCANLNNEIIAAALMIDFTETRTYLYGGSSNQNRNVMAPYALHWTAMQDAKNSGLKFYDWWGLRTSEGKISGFTEFKLRFGGKEITYPRATDIVTNQAWYTIYTVLRKLNRFFLHLPFLKK